jgi:hypothetical protein
VAVELHGALRAAQAATLTVEIVNPNPFPLDAVVLKIDGKSIKIDQIAPSSTQQAEVLMAAVTSQEAEVQVSWFLRCTTVSGKYEQEGRQTLSVRRLQMTDTSLDDMFDL